MKQNIKDENFIIPMYSDTGLKGAIKSNKKFFITFASKLLNIPIDSIKDGEFIDNEVVNDNYKDYRKRVDLIFKVSNTYLINMEANTYSHGVIARNNQYVYRLILDNNMFNRTIDNTSVIQINIDKASFSMNKKLINVFNTREVDTNVILPFTPVIIHIDLDKSNDINYTKDIDEWLLKAIRLFNASSKSEYKKIASNDPILEGVEKFMYKYSEDKHVIGEYDAELDAKMINDFDKKEAREEGMKQGISIGRNSGIQEEKTQTAKNMIHLNIDVDTISKVTGLSLDEIKSLK